MCSSWRQLNFDKYNTWINQKCCSSLINSKTNYSKQYHQDFIVLTLMYSTLAGKFISNWNNSSVAIFLAFWIDSGKTYIFNLIASLKYQQDISRYWNKKTFIFYNSTYWDIHEFHWIWHNRINLFFYSRFIFFSLLLLVFIWLQMNFPSIFSLVLMLTLQYELSQKKRGKINKNENCVDWIACNNISNRIEYDSCRREKSITIEHCDCTIL